MAWGNFLVIPCTCKLWDSRLNRLMLAFLPEIGALIGGTLALLLLAAHALMLPALLTGLLLTYALLRIPGYMHLDGFMDVSDAVMSRRGKEERQRILKDSHTGAFAVISVVFLLMGFHAFFSSALSISIDFVDLCLIPAVSRSASGLNVLLRRPMGTSQYAKGEGASDSKQKKNAACIILIQLILYCAAGLLLASQPLYTLAVIAATFLGSLIAVFCGCRQLGGMNGDIAGFGIVWGELLGVLALAVI